MSIVSSNDRSSIVDPRLTRGFQALCDPHRLQILDQLRSQEQCVCDLSTSLQIPQSKLSFHLKTLKEAGLIESRQQGRWIYYRITLPQFNALTNYLQTFTSEAIDRPNCCD